LQHALLSGTRWLGSAIVALDDAVSILHSLWAIDGWLHSTGSQPSEKQRIQWAKELMACTDEQREPFAHQLSMLYGLREALTTRSSLVVPDKARAASEEIACRLFLGLVAYHAAFPTLDNLLAATRDPSWK
jgi:hypothetical protein